MPWEYKYDGPAETEIKSMKEGRSSDSVEYIKILLRISSVSCFSLIDSKLVELVVLVSV
jgi:hypothetical protein